MTVERFAGPLGFHVGAGADESVEAAGPGRLVEATRFDADTGVVEELEGPDGTATTALITRNRLT